jgi:phage terminase small subunit
VKRPPLPKLAPAPATLGTAARDVWRSLIGDLAARRELSAEDLVALECYCRAAVELRSPGLAGDVQRASCA